MKKCTKCKIEKEIIEFSKDKQKKDGYRPSCKSCNNRNANKMVDIDRERLRLVGIEFLKNNPEYIKTCAICKENLDHSRFHKNYKSKDGLGYKCKVCQNQYMKDNKEHLKKKRIEYVKNNRKKIRTTKRKRHMERMSTDSLYNFEMRTRKMIYNSFYRGGYTKNSKASELIGLNYNDLMIWLNDKASNGLNLNLDKIHIDHVIPIGLCNNESDINTLNHFSNLQLMSESENIIKSNTEPSFEQLKRVFNNHNNKEELYKIIFK